MHLRLCQGWGVPEMHDTIKTQLWPQSGAWSRLAGRVPGYLPACLLLLGICSLVSLLSIPTTLASSKNAHELPFFPGLFYPSLKGWGSHQIFQLIQSLMGCQSQEPEKQQHVQSDVKENKRFRYLFCLVIFRKYREIIPLWIIKSQFIIITPA